MRLGKFFRIIISMRNYDNIQDDGFLFRSAPWCNTSMEQERVFSYIRNYEDYFTVH